MEHGLGDIHALGPELTEVGNVENSIHHGDAKQRDKADRRRDAEIEAGQIQRDQAAADRKRDTGNRQQAVAQRIEQTVKQHKNEKQRDRHHDQQPLLGILEIVELTGPKDLVSVRELDGLGDAPLCLLDRTTQIAAANAELDRNEPLAALAIDERSAGIERDVSQFAQRNIPVGARRGRISHRDGTNGRNAGAVFGVQPDRQVELSIPFEDGCRIGAAECSLNHGIDVTGIETVAGGFFAVDLDVEIGLTEQVKYAEVGNALNLGHLGHHLGGQRFQRLQIWSDDLDRIGALDARKGFLDVVLDILREVEANSRQFLAEFLLQLLGQFFLGEVGRPFVKRLERRKQLDIGER